MCAHREPAYSGKNNWSCASPAADGKGETNSCKQLCESERAQDQTIILPLYFQMTDQDQDRVVKSLIESCRV